MNLLRRFPAMAFALSLLAIAGFCVATESFGWLVVAGTMAALSWYYTEGPRGRTLPRWVANLLLVAAVLYAVADWLQRSSSGEIMDVVGRFTLILTVIKLYENKSARDYGQLLALGAVLMVAGALQSVQLSFAVLLLAYVLLGLYVVLLFQLHVAHERARAARRALAPEGAPFVPAVQPAFGRRLRGGFGSFGAAMACTTLLISGAVFVVFPRGILAAESVMGGGRRQTGLAEVSLRDNSRISESRREVFTVAVLDPQGQPIEWTGPVLMRGLVLDQYVPTDARWTTSKSARESSRTLLGRGPEVFVPLGMRAIDTRVQTYTQVVTMSSMASDVLFSAFAPVAMAVEADRAIAFETATLLLREKKAGKLGSSREYRIRFQPFPSAETMESLGGESAMLSTPAAWHNPGVFQMARDILRARGVPEQAPRGDSSERTRWRLAVARAFMDELQSDRFSYTTDLSDFVVERTEDPTWAFLSKYRFGHCEHFAAAMVVLCRSVGVEARLIAGYIAMEFDASARHYIVRESNAHAWVEVRTGTANWTTFDPTPPDTLEAINESRRTWVDHWRWMYDRIEFMWNNRIVGFDSSTQATLAERLSSRWLRSVQEAVAGLGERMGQINAAFKLGPAGYIWLGLLGAVGVLAVITAITLTRRARSIRRVTGLESARGGQARRLVRELGFYADALDLLERGGLSKPAWQPPLEFAREVGARRPELAEPVRGVVDEFYRVRFGGQSADMDVVRGLLRRLGELIRR